MGAFSVHQQSICGVASAFDCERHWDLVCLSDVEQKSKCFRFTKQFVQIVFWVNFLLNNFTSKYSEEMQIEKSFCRVHQ